MRRFVQPSIVLYFFLLLLGISGFFFVVIWPQAVGFYMFIVFASAGGIGVAGYIYYMKRHDKQLICPVGSDCNAVITSRYAKFLGVSLEYWGMFYYAIIFINYILLIFTSHLLSVFFLTGLMMLTAGAFLFSLYLLFVQAFVLRQWCIWCLLSAMLSIAIFITSLISVDFAIALLTEITVIIEAVRVLGFTLGMGGATTALFLFSRFLRDLDIDEQELKTLKGVSELVWLGLVLVLVSQFASYVAYAETLALSGPFLAETISLFVVVVSGAVLTIIIAPFLAVISFNDNVKDDRNSPVESLRTPLFITGAIMFSSWYFAFIMNYLTEYTLTFLLLVYMVILAIAVLAGLFWERGIYKRSS